MTHYLIEFRFFGKAKYEIKRLIYEISSRFRIRLNHRAVPHISLAGPFRTRNQRKLVSDFKSLCSKQSIMEFNRECYDFFENNHVVFINIKSSQDLDDFRWKLSKSLQPYCKLKSYDYKRNFEYHATLFNRLDQKKFEEVKKYIEKQKKPNYKHCLMRAALIKNQKILYEYDFFLKKLLNRREAKNKFVLNKSYQELKENLKKKNMTDTGFDSLIPIEEITIEDIKISFFNKILNKFRKRNIFFIGDLHLDHKNIIKFCNRSFKSVEEMNKVIIDNWNKTVKRNDIIFFLGDMAFGKGSKKTSYWLKKLNGNIIFIKGGHDRSRKIKFYHSLILKYNNYRFLLLHDPKDAPSNWKDWIIHGHKHNNHMKDYPLINGMKKTINVSCELINYTPININ